MSTRPNEGAERSERKFNGRRGRNKRRKVCYFTANKIQHIDYKDIELLKKFISERGKILPRRVTSSNSSTHTVALPRGNNRTYVCCCTRGVGENGDRFA